MQIEPAAQPLCLHHAAGASASVPSWVCLFHDMGGNPLNPDLVRMVHAEAGEHDEGFAKIIAATSGTDPRTLMGHSAFAQKVNIDRATCKRHVLTLAACIHWSARLWVSNVLSMAATEIALKNWKAVCCFTYVLYDETPLPLKTHGGQKQAKQAGSHLAPLAAGSTASTSTAMRVRDAVAAASSLPSVGVQKEQGMTKILQSEGTVGLLLQHLATGRMHFLTLPISCPLQGCDRGTASVLRAALYQQLDVPLLQQFMKSADFSLTAATCDRATANNTCEENVKSDSAFPRIRLPCVAHIAATAQGRSFDVIDLVVSGVINTSLAQEPGRAPEKFRQALCDVIAASVVPMLGAPPPASDAKQAHLRAVLDLCVPLDKDTPKHTRQHLLLQAFLAGDPESDVIHWYGAGDSPDIPAYAQTVSEALYPCAIKVLRRQRWLSSVVEFQQYTLLCLHNLLPRTVRRWLLVMAGKDPGPVPVQQAVAATDTTAGALALQWDLPESDEEQAVAEAAVVPVDVAGGEVEHVWRRWWRRGQRHQQQQQEQVAEAEALAAAAGRA